MIKVRVLEVTTKPEDFLSDNENADGDPIIEEEGLYMKIKPTAGFDMNFNEATARTFQGSSHLRYPTETYTSPIFGTDDGMTFTPYKLSGGSRVRIFIKFKARGAIAYEGIYDKTFTVSEDYNSIQDWFDTEVVDLGSFGEDYTRGDDMMNNRGTGWDFTPDGSQFWVRAHRDGTASRNITTEVRFEVLFSNGTVIFETEAEDSNTETYYETTETYPIVGNFHEGNIQNQTATQPVIVELDFFNCYVQGNGAESYRYKDAFNTNYLNIDLRPTSTSVEEYRAVRRYADLTYSEPYSENNNKNGLNEFNLARANFKEDIDKKYGYIQKLFSRDTNLVVFQQDKVSYVLFGKDLLMNADGTSNVSSIEDGQELAINCL